MKRILVCLFLCLLFSGCSAPEPLAQCEQAYAALQEADSVSYWTNAPGTRWFDGQTVMIAGQDWLVVSVDGLHCWKYLYVDGQYLSCLHSDERLAWKSSAPQADKAPAPDWSRYSWKQHEMTLLSTETHGDTVTHRLTSGFLGTQWQFTFTDDTLTALEVTVNGTVTRYEFDPDAPDPAARIQEEFRYYTNAETDEPPVDPAP